MIDLNSTIESLNALNKGTLMENLGIEYLETKDGFVAARMPIDQRTLQPAGILHGGSSLALAETIGGLGSMLLVNHEEFVVRGSHISANHVRPGVGKWVIAKANLIHRGKNTHLWDIEIFDEQNQLISSCRLTNFILPKNGNS
ncbi:MAG TPA: thioesterase [Bacteroidales bacterium]|nr:thioesterase [Bacteroidales bacterium]